MADAQFGRRRDFHRRDAEVAESETFLKKYYFVFFVTFVVKSLSSPTLRTLCLCGESYSLNDWNDWNTWNDWNLSDVDEDCR